MSIQIETYSPGQNLSPYVQFYWKGKFNNRATGSLSQHVIPNGFVELIIHLSYLHCDLPSYQGWCQSPDYTVIGLHTRPYEVQFRDYVRTFGIRFKPEGIYNLFGIPASEFLGGYEDMALVLGTEFRDFCDRIREANCTEEMVGMAEDYLIGAVQRNQIDLSYVNQAAELIRQSGGTLKIEELPNLIYISLRQLERAFKDQIGISPKHYVRLSRINAVHRLLEENSELNLTEVAYHSGYADQAHFSRDFKNITGVNPTVFVRESSRFMADSSPEGNP